MSATKFIDYADLKKRIPITDVLRMLNIKTTPKGEQLRSCCPIHKGTDDRGFVVTPSKNLWHCFKGCGGGDQIKLVACITKGSPHVDDADQKAAAHLIDQHFGGTIPPTVGNTVRTEPSKPLASGLAPLAYLEPQHEAVQSLGVSPETAKSWESGYAPKGMMRGRYAVPVNSKDGTLLGYVGIALTAEQTPRFLLPSNLDPQNVIFAADRVQAGVVYLVRSPLDVLVASENGVDNAVAFLSDITAQHLEMLAALMDERKCDSLELC